MTLRPWVVSLLLPLAACASPDPAKELKVSEVEAYWSIDSSTGDTVYVAPVLRFRLDNLSATASIEATASFKRKGEDASWGSAWQRLSVPGKRLDPGRSQTVALKSDGRYFTTGASFPSSTIRASSSRNTASSRSSGTAVSGSPLRRASTSTIALPPRKVSGAQPTLTLFAAAALARARPSATWPRACSSA